MGFTSNGELPRYWVGTDENEIQKLVVEQMETWKKALELLACEELPTQLSLLIGRWTMTAKPSALTRSLPPNIINKPLADFGEAVLKTMEERLKLRLEGEARQLFQLPLDEGGVGFCPPEETAPYAFPGGRRGKLPGLWHHQHQGGRKRLGKQRGVVTFTTATCVE